VGIQGHYDLSKNVRLVKENVVRRLFQLFHPGDIILRIPHIPLLVFSYDPRKIFYQRYNIRNEGYLLHLIALLKLTRITQPLIQQL
jgi:hypothetical protein